MKIKEEWQPGDVHCVRCPTHGSQEFIAGIHFPAGGPAPSDCPFCRLMMSGKMMCGEGYIDHSGVAYIVDIHGNLRKLSKLTDQQAERIKGRKKLLRKEKPSG